MDGLELNADYDVVLAIPKGAVLYSYKRPLLMRLIRVFKLVDAPADSLGLKLSAVCGFVVPLDIKGIFFLKGFLAQDTHGLLKGFLRGVDDQVLQYKLLSSGLHPRKDKTISV